MDSTANILQFCRLCLVKDGVNIPIFDEQGDIRQIYLKISSCLPVKVAREDHLPKKICDGCSNKLDNFYDFWRTSAESEKQLLAWLGATGKDAAQVNVKEEDNFDEPLASDISKNDDDENKCYMFEQKVEEGPPVEINDEPPPSKRPRRTAAVKAAIAMDQNSDDDGDSGEPITKMEDDSDETDGDDREPAFVDVPSTSADDQPGPSGVSKDGSDAPFHIKEEKDEEKISDLVNSELHIKDEKEEETADPKLKNYNCTECSKTFSAAQNLRKHKIIQSNPKYACDLCDKVFRQKYNLDYHKNSKHFRKHTFSCDKCSKAYSTISELNRHIKFDHEGARYSCLQCGKKSKSKTHLVLHMRTHTGEKPYECEFCGKTFARNDTLVEHRRVHTKERPYKCTFCNKGFTQKSALNVHKRTHSCLLCARWFDTKQLFKQHQCSGSPGYEKLYVCSVCTQAFTQNTLLARHMLCHTESESQMLEKVKEEDTLDFEVDVKIE